jgi:hypothetical protein
MPDAFLPPWIGTPADPAAETATGIGLGQRDVALRLQQQEEQAALQEQAFQQQQQAQATALAQQKQQIATKAAADKASAVLSYQNALRGGTDPLQAILQYGPAMGQQASPEAAALRASYTAPKAALPPPQWVPANDDTGAPGYFISNGRPFFPPKGQPDISSSERAATIRELDSQEKEIITDNPDIMLRARHPEKLSPDELAVLQQLKDIERQKQELLPRLKQNGKTDSDRVAVVDPSGKKGTIPSMQVDDALAAGYQLAQ